MKKSELVKKGFKCIVNESGANVLEKKISKNVSLRTWGNSVNGVQGVCLYDKRRNIYSEGNFVI